MKPATRQTLDFLRARGQDGATPAEARSAIACDRLAARVHELREYGFRIESVSERTPMGARIARYYLLPESFAPLTGSQPPLFPDDSPQSVRPVVPPRADSGALRGAAASRTA